MKLTKSEKKLKLLESLKKTNGIISSACSMSGISRATYYNYCQDKSFENQANEIIESTIDKVENILLSDLIFEQKNLKAIIFYLSSKASHRKYGTIKREIEENDKESFAINIHTT